MKKSIKLVYPGQHRDVTGHVAETPDVTVVYIEEPFDMKVPTTEEMINNAGDIAVLDVMAELERAVRKHPLWPVDLLHAWAIVQEEVGETQREVLQYVQETKPEDLRDKAEMIRKEAIESAGMILRFLTHLNTHL